jgi:hypothetical protein
MLDLRGLGRGKRIRLFWAKGMAGPASGEVAFYIFLLYEHQTTPIIRLRA